MTRTTRPSPTPEELQWWLVTNSKTDLDTGCRVWKRPTKNGRAGSIQINGKKVIASRVALLLASGQDGVGLCCCHRCDNPPCVNPQHLFWGTYSENTRDAMTKGRFKPGTYPKRRRFKKPLWEMLHQIGGYQPP
jgi:hypothetical protein